jgi:superfamily II DNA or RNA helicase
MRNLQELLDTLPFNDLPPAWTTFDLATFSRGKTLWDYQQAALTNALKALWRYYTEPRDYRPGETEVDVALRKQALYRWYTRYNLTGPALDLSLKRVRRDIETLLTDYYPISLPERGRLTGGIAYEHFINRMGFWMATGSGKTLVLVKLLELLWHLRGRGVIPPHNVMVLTHRDDLLDQLRVHVGEYNTMPASGGLDRPRMRLHDLRAYPDVMRSTPSLFGDQELPVFIYRSDNLSDEQKERIVDYRNYENAGRWYILLDEAHKGDREDSKRQHIYSILARNGFLFNFSATFTDPRDVLATAYDFNLARFVASGYGKHITILKQENRAFRERDDYTHVEKQKIVLKALLLLAYVRQARQNLPVGDDVAYHSPLLLVLVNSVNVEDADLKLFFREVERIAQGEVAASAFAEAKAELWAELKTGPELLFEGTQFQADAALYDALTLDSVRTSVYHTSGAGSIEVLTRPSDRQEIAFKLKTADRPFALIKIGDITDWLKRELAEYEVVAGFDDEGYFERLNHDDSDINILMGSRSFYEGWDSNRPNVITYVNIGTGTDAKKFILQSVGRGVRIEPLPNVRRRLQFLGDQVSDAQFTALRDVVAPLETLFIFGTNRQALHTVIAQMRQEEGDVPTHQLCLDLNPQVQGKTLLIPTYRLADRPLLEQRAPAKFPITENELALLQSYIDYLGDSRVLMARHHATPRQASLVQQTLADPHRYFRMDGRPYGDLNVLIPRLWGYLNIVPQEWNGLKPLADEIRHFQQIKVQLKDITELQGLIDGVRHYQDPVTMEAELDNRFLQERSITAEEYKAGIKRLGTLQPVATFRHPEGDLEIRHVAAHYYLPLILSEFERATYINHVIRHPSEVKFVHDLEAYLQKPDNGFTAFDWWLFSKLDETVDSVYLPYYDPNVNAIRRFNPDFVFWLQRGKEYHVLFVDPKGTQLSGYQHKVDGYASLFSDADTRQPRVWRYGDLDVYVHLALYTHDANLVSAGYQGYWYDRVEQLIPLSTV